MMESICIDCGIVFNYTSIKKDVIRCGKCVKKLYNKNYREKNKEELSAKKKIYEEKNKDKISAKNKIYREKNKEIISAKYKNYREKNKEELSAKKKIYWEKNKEIISAKKKIYVEKNKDKIALRGKTYRDNLGDGYIAGILKIPLLECPTELIELKRAVIMLKREINK